MKFHPSSFILHPLLRHTQAFKTGGSGAPDPAKINISQELNQLLKGYQDTAGGFADLQKQFQPIYTKLGLDTTATQQQGYTDEAGVYHPGTTALNTAANTATRTANTEDLGRIAPGITGTILNSVPGLGNALFYQDENLRKAAGGSPILSSLNQQAEAGLASGGRTTPAEDLASSEAALSYFGNAGTSHGNGAIAAQLLNRDASVRSRQQQAQTFAGNVQGLNTQQEGLVGTLAAGQASTGTNSILGPIMQILGLGTLTPGNGNTGGSSTGSAVSTGNSLFPLAPGFDAGEFNANAQNASNIAGANSDAATNAALIGLLGAFLSDDRLKKGMKYTGEKTPEGIPITSFIYKHDPKKKRFEGVRASDVEKVRPDAVLTDPLSGLRAVDYRAIGVPLSIQERLLEAA